MNHWEIAREAVRRGAIQKPSEFAPLVKYLRQFDLRTVVEIGTCKGGSFWAWCQIAAPEALLVSVDMRGGPFGGGSTEAEDERIAAYRQPGQMVEMIRGDSHDKAIVESVHKALGERVPDLVFVDGDHTYEGVKADYLNYHLDGKLVVFHDILNHPFVPECQVDKFWLEIRSGRRYKEFVDGREQWGGIGLLISE